MADGFSGRAVREDETSRRQFCQPSYSFYMLPPQHPFPFKGGTTFFSQYDAVAWIRTDEVSLLHDHVVA